MIRARARRRPRGAGPAPLLVPRAPEAVAHQERVEDVGADEPRVVGLEQVAPARVRPLQDGPGEQHPGRLAAHQPGADHVPADREQVLQVEVVAGQLGEPLLARQHHAEQRAEGVALLLPRALRGADPLGHLPRLQEAAVPDVEPREGVEAPLGGVGQRLGHRRALGERAERAVLPPVGQVHGGRVPPQHLERVDEDRAPPPEHVHQQLGGAPDGVDRLRRVRVAQQREVGHRLELVEERAGDHEEVAEHQVAVPVGREPGEAVEDVVGAPPGGLDHAVHRGGEALEAHRRIEPVDLDARALRDERRVARELEVDEPPALGPCPRHERLHQRRVELDRVDLPHDVVAGAEPAHDGVERREAGAGRGGGGGIGQARHELRMSHRPPGLSTSPRDRDAAASPGRGAAPRVSHRPASLRPSVPRAPPAGRRSVRGRPRARTPAPRPARCSGARRRRLRA